MDILLINLQIYIVGEALTENDIQAVIDTYKLTDSNLTQTSKLTHHSHNTVKKILIDNNILC